MTGSFEERRQQWVLDARRKHDLDIVRGRVTRPGGHRNRPRRVPASPRPLPQPPPISIVEQYLRLRARVLAGEITPAQAGHIFSRAG